MLSLQISSCRAFDLRATASLSASFYGGETRLLDGGRKLRFGGGILRVRAMSNAESSYKMNLNEYMVTLEKPLGLRFALSADGKIIVHGIKRGSNAEKSRIVMVGDTLKKAGEASGGKLVEIKDCGDAQEILKNIQNVEGSLGWPGSGV